MFMLIVLLLFGGSTLVRWWMLRTYTRWRRQPNAIGATGWQVARSILDHHGLHQVHLEVAPGHLSDHYIPAQKLLRLSESIGLEASVAAVAVAAHECGHALQDAEGYAPLRLKAILMPLAVVSNNLGLMLVISGSLLGNMNLADLGILIFAVALLVPLLMLPIEFDASRRALTELQRLHLVDQTDLEGSRSMLTAAALTYLAGAAASVAVAGFLLLRMLRR